MPKFKEKNNTNISHSESSLLHSGPPNFFQPVVIQLPREVDMYKDKTDRLKGGFCTIFVLNRLV